MPTDSGCDVVMGRGKHVVSFSFTSNQPGQHMPKILTLLMCLCITLYNVEFSH